MADWSAKGGQIPWDESEVAPKPDNISVYVGSCLPEGTQLSDPYLLEAETTSIFSSSREGGHMMDFSAVSDSLLSAKFPFKVENS